ncbi:Glucosidase 2 subunit beta, partial [Phytophthora megakarya]
MVKEQNPLSLRRTMVKPTIGTVRRTTYDLPDARNPKHVYGYELPRDPENAGQVISKWVHATPSPAAMSGRSFIETNRQAVVHGCISAGQNRRFANEHPGIVVRPISKCRGGFVPSKDMTFGIKSKPSEDMWGLMQSRYTSFKNDNTDYPDLSMMKTKGKLPLPRETKSSIGRDVRNWPRIQHSTPFKMKKFKGVRPIMYTQPKARQQEHLLLVLPALSAAVPIRGVSPSDQVKYLNGFSCVVDGKAAKLPISRVNDEFCDCDDGLDEPGTSACSHVLKAEFHCENNGFFPGKIHTSRIHDGVCDCCDGTDEEKDGKSQCPNTCASSARKFRKEAEERLEVVKIGFEKRQATVKGEIAAYFTGEKEAETTTGKELAGLKLLKDRVTVHKDREELKEKKYKMEVARQKQAEAHDSKQQFSDAEEKEAVEALDFEGLDAIQVADGDVPVNEAEDERASEILMEVARQKQAEAHDSKQQFSDAEEKEAIEALDFEGLDAIRVADEDVPVNEAEDERASEILDSRRQTVTSLIELPDGTRISLASYLRMNHNKQAPTKKLRAPRTVEEMRREDFLGPLFNGGTEGRKKIGLYALRTIGTDLFTRSSSCLTYLTMEYLSILSIGIIISPIRALVELLLFSPRTLWSVLSSREIAGSVINKLPNLPSPS